MQAMVEAANASGAIDAAYNVRTWSGSTPNILASLLMSGDGNQTRPVARSMLPSDSHPALVEDASAPARYGRFLDAGDCP